MERLCLRFHGQALMLSKLDPRRAHVGDELIDALALEPTGQSIATRNATPAHSTAVGRGHAGALCILDNIVLRILRPGDTSGWASNANSHDTSPANRTSPSLLQARLASTRKLQRILGIEAPDVGQYTDLIPASPSSPEPSHRPLSSAFEYEDELDLAIDGASAEKDEPPQLFLKRETVDFAQTLLRLGDAEYAWADEVDRGLGLCLADAPSDDQATPTTRNYIRPLTVDPFFSPPTALTPVQL
jgi:hypothetical protein